MEIDYSLFEQSDEKPLDRICDDGGFTAITTNGESFKFGDVGDIDFSDYRNNKHTFTGCYAAIIERLKAMQPRAKFFPMTLPDDGTEGVRPDYYLKIREFLYYLAEKFDNTYILNLFEYVPKYDEKFKSLFCMRGHLNPMGYLFTAKMTASYIDYIIRHNMDNFKEVGFIGTDLKSK